MQSAAVKLNALLENLAEEDYDKAVSYIEFLIEKRKKQAENLKRTEDRTDVESIVASLIGVIPDTGKTLEEYRGERLKRYENSY